MADIISDDGKLLISKDINRNMVEVSQGVDGLQLKLGGIVGRLPINSGLFVDIAPKFPMSNLAHLVARSGENYSRAFDIEQTYGVVGQDGFLPELLLKGFAHSLNKSLIEGTYRSYARVEIEDGVKPKVNLAKTIQKFWSRGTLNKTASTVFDFGVQNYENRLLKNACEAAFSLSQNSVELSDQHKVFGIHLRRLRQVKSMGRSEFKHKDIAKTHSVPSFRKTTINSIEIAAEILMRTNLSSIKTDNKFKMPSFLINLENAFEGYMRMTLSRGAKKSGLQLEIGDGNKAPWKKHLLDAGDTSPAKPDILISSTGEDVFALVGDVKYKQGVNVEDKYQVITHALSYKVQKSLLILPATDQNPVGLTFLGSLGPDSFRIKVWAYYFDLSGELCEQEELLVDTVLNDLLAE